MNAYGMLAAVIIKTKTKSLPLEEFGMSVQEYNISRYGYKKWINLRGQFLLFS